MARRRHKAVWAAALAIGAGLIFFSSTNRAGRLAGYYFDVWIHRAHHYLRFSWRLYPSLSFAAEKGVHIVLFTAFGFLLGKLLARSSHRWTKVLVYGCATGIASEAMQRFFVTRDPSLRDVLLNAAGTCTGALLCRLTD